MSKDSFIDKIFILLTGNPFSYHVDEHKYHRKYLSRRELDECLLPLISQILEQQKLQTSYLRTFQHEYVKETQESCKCHDSNEKNLPQKDVYKKRLQQHSKPEETQDSIHRSSGKSSIFEKSSSYPDVTATTCAGGALQMGLIL